MVNQQISLCHSRLVHPCKQISQSKLSNTIRSKSTYHHCLDDKLLATANKERYFYLTKKKKRESRKITKDRAAISCRWNHSYMGCHDNSEGLVEKILNLQWIVHLLNSLSLFLNFFCAVEHLFLTIRSGSSVSDMSSLSMSCILLAAILSMTDRSTGPAI